MPIFPIPAVERVTRLLAIQVGHPLGDSEAAKRWAAWHDAGPRGAKLLPLPGRKGAPLRDAAGLGARHPAGRIGAQGLTLPLSERSTYRNGKSQR